MNKPERSFAQGETPYNVHIDQRSLDSASDFGN